MITVSSAHLVHDTYSSFLAPLLPVLIENLSLTKTAAGLLSVFYQWPSLLQPLIGHLGDRVNLKILVILAPTVAALMMTLLGVAPTYAVLALLLIVAGFNSAGLHAIGPIIAGKLSGGKLGPRDELLDGGRRAGAHHRPADRGQRGDAAHPARAALAGVWRPGRLGGAVPAPARCARLPPARRATAWPGARPCSSIRPFLLPGRRADRRARHALRRAAHLPAHLPYRKRRGAVDGRRVALGDGSRRGGRRAVWRGGLRPAGPPPGAAGDVAGGAAGSAAVPQRARLAGSSPRCCWWA